MSTTPVLTEQAGALTTEKQTYRAYVKTETDAKGATVIKDIKAKAAAAAKDKDSGLAVNWQKLENDGYTLFNENEFIRYSVKSLEGFKLLVPDETQQAYIIQAGLNYVQNAKANAAMVAEKEGEPEPTALYNQETIDLRDAINEAPTRKSVSDIDKLLKLLTAMGVPADKQEAVLAAMIAEKSEATESVEA